MSIPILTRPPSIVPLPEKIPLTKSNVEAFNRLSLKSNDEGMKLDDLDDQYDASPEDGSVDEESEKTGSFQEDSYTDWAEGEAKSSSQDPEAIARHQAWYNLETNHFFHHMKGKEAYFEEEQRCHKCQIRSFSTHDAAPTSIVNQVENDLSVLNPDFKFIEHSIYSPRVKLPSIEILTGCDCKDWFHCMKKQCDCQQEVLTEDATDEQKISPYHVVGGRKGLMRARFLNGMDPIYECSSRCACGPRCANKVVGNGRDVPLQVFRTNNGRGWGVFT